MISDEWGKHICALWKADGAQLELTEQMQSWKCTADGLLMSTGQLCLESLKRPHKRRYQVRRKAGAETRRSIWNEYTSQTLHSPTPLLCFTKTFHTRTLEVYSLVKMSHIGH